MFLVFNLKSAFASWGTNWESGDSRVHKTAVHPTKSAICGLLGAAYGADLEIPGSNPFAVQPPEMLTASIHESLVTDFQYMTRTLMNSKTRELEKAEKADLSDREYLSGSKNVIVLKLPTDLAEKAAKALESPVYPLCLGRAACSLGCLPEPFLTENLDLAIAEAKGRFAEMSKTSGYQAKHNVTWTADFRGVFAPFVRGLVQFPRDGVEVGRRYSENRGRPLGCFTEREVIVGLLNF